jgi:hypothetical protein
MDYFHYCNDRKDLENKGEKRKQSPCRDPPHVKIPSRNLGKNGAIELGRKEPPCQGHPSLAGFKEYQKTDNERSTEICKYAVNNPEDFCETCGLNLKYTKHLLASYQYEALVISRATVRFVKVKRERFVMRTSINNIIARLV